MAAVAVLLLVSCTDAGGDTDSTSEELASSPPTSQQADDPPPTSGPDVVPLPGTTETVENATFDEEPGAARAATAELEEAVASGDSGRVVARPEDAQVIADLATLDLDETTWDRVGNVATVEGVADGEAYLVWLIRFEDGTWRISHTTDPGPSA